MGKTYKSLPYGYFRSPKGKRRYDSEREIAKLDREEMIPSIRHKAIPPDPWDDINCDKAAFAPYKIAGEMKKRGMNRDSVIRKIVKKFHLTHFQAEEIFKYA